MTHWLPQAHLPGFRFYQLTDSESLCLPLQPPPPPSLPTSSGRNSVLDPPPGFCDNGAAPHSSAQTKPDSMHPMPSNYVHRPVGDMADTRDFPETISILREPAAAERILLSLLGPADTRIMQEYDDGGLRKNLAHHALSACLHFAMWLRENGGSSSASRELGEVRARVLELEKRVRKSEETVAKQEAEIEMRRHQVQEYESKLIDVLNDLGQLRQKAEACQKMWKEQETLHHERAENGELSSTSKERDEARAHVAELEERVKNSEETAAKQEAEIKILRHQVQEYESKLNGWVSNAGLLWKKAEACKMKWKEQEALHQEKATRLDEVLRQLEEANADLAKVTQNHEAARAHIEKLTGALTRTRQLYEQAEVEMKKVQQDCETEKEEHSKKRIAVTSEMELKEDFQNEKQKKKKNEDGIMLTTELNKDLNKNSPTFWTMCNHCEGQYYEYHRVHLNHLVCCSRCHEPFLAIEKDPPLELFESASNFSCKQLKNSRQIAVTGNSFTSGSQVAASGTKPPSLGVFFVEDPGGRSG